MEVLSGERLDEARGATLGETVNTLPGVQSSNFGAGVGRPIIRGLDGARVSILSGGLQTQDVSTVSQDHAPAVESFLADQIEVLKGPSTLLYGSGAIGGVVNVVDGRVPECRATNGSSGRAEARRQRQRRLHRHGTFGCGTDRFAFHVDGVYRDNGDYDTPDGTQANSFLKTKTGAVGGSLLGDWGFVGFSAVALSRRYGNPGEPGNPEEGELGVLLDMKQSRNELKGGINHLFSDNGRLRFSLADTDYEHIEFEGADIGTQFFKTPPKAARNTLDRLRRMGAVGGQASTSEFEAIGEEAFVPRVQTRSFGIFGSSTSWNDFQLDMGARIDDIRQRPGRRRGARSSNRSARPSAASGTSTITGT